MTRRLRRFETAFARDTAMVSMGPEGPLAENFLKGLRSVLGSILPFRLVYGVIVAVQAISIGPRCEKRR